MTVTFGTNANNDIYLGNDKNMIVLSGLAAITKACETASKAQLGEMVLAIGLGIPNFQAVWIGTPNLPLFESYLQRTLASIDGVTEVQFLKLVVNNNTLSYTAQIKTVYGAISIGG